jgi:hypothetical protein
MTCGILRSASLVVPPPSFSMSSRPIGINAEPTGLMPLMRVPVTTIFGSSFAASAGLSAVSLPCAKAGADTSASATIEVDMDNRDAAAGRTENFLAIITFSLNQPRSFARQSNTEAVVTNSVS